MNIPENFDRWMFDYMEGNLSLIEVEEFEQFIVQNPSFEPDADAWNLATISNESIVYPNQHQLERKPILFGWVTWSAAAFLLLLVGIGGYLSLNSNLIQRSQNLSQFTKPSNNLGVGSMNKVIDIAESNHAIILSSNQSFSNNLGQLVSHASQTNSRSERNDMTYLNGVNSNINTNDSEVAYDYLNASKMVGSTIEHIQSKLNGDTHQSQYVNNPTVSGKELDLSKTKDMNYRAFSIKMKKLYRKIENILGYQTGIVNLRDPDLLMPENSILASNPGFAGGMLKSRFEMKYRNQWLGSDLSAQKSQFSYDYYMASVRSGVSIILNSDIYGNGAFTDHSVDLSFSPKIVINKDIVFEPGIKVSLGLLTGNTSKLAYAPNVEMDRGLVVNNNIELISDQMDKKWYKDYGLGFVINTTWFYAGFSADNLGNHYSSVYRSEGNISPEKTPILYNAVVGYDWEGDKKRSAISPFVSYRQFGELREAWAGLTVGLNHFTFGGSYSTQNNFTGSIGMKFPKFKLMYQFDQSQSLLFSDKLASHNIGIRFIVDSKKKSTI